MRTDRLRWWCAATMAAALLGACAEPGDLLPGAAPDPAPTGDAAADEADGGDGPDDTAEQGSDGADVDPSTLPPAPEPAPAFELSADEVLPNAKRLASDVVQALLTYEHDETVRDVAERVVDPARIDAVAAALDPAHHPGSWSRAQIVYPQLGGSTSTRSAVMVVVDQTIGSTAGERTERRTVDVRLRVVEGQWQLEAIASIGGTPEPRPDALSEVATAVLDDPRIELPDSARWDIHAGRTADSLLELLLEIAELAPYSVAVLETGHPFNVFGTPRVSRHMAGFAVDIYAFDGVLVVDDRRPDGVTFSIVETLFDRDDVRVIGSPWALDGFGGRSFTDLVHQDHLHVESFPTDREVARARERGVLRDADELEGEDADELEGEDAEDAEGDGG